MATVALDCKECRSGIAATRAERREVITTVDCIIAGSEKESIGHRRLLMHMEERERENGESNHEQRAVTLYFDSIHQAFQNTVIHRRRYGTNAGRGSRILTSLLLNNWVEVSCGKCMQTGLGDCFGDNNVEIRTRCAPITCLRSQDKIHGSGVPKNKFELFLSSEDALVIINQ